MGVEQPKGDQTSVTSFDVLRPLRIRDAITWTTGVLSVVLLLIERQLRVIHPLSIPFIVLLIVVFGATLELFVRGFWRLLMGPRRLAAFAWTIMGLLPFLFWLALGFYGHQQWENRNVPRNLAMDLVRMAGTRLMEVQARFLYPYRLETDRIVMFYGDEIADPQADLEAMDKHVAHLELMTGLTHRSKIWWIRGKLLGQGPLAVGGLALGSSKSPAEHTDRHELAHAIIYHGDFPGTDPPTLLTEGWAEAQSVDSKTLANRADYWHHFFPKMGPWWEAIERDNKQDTVPDPEGHKNLFKTISERGRIDSYLDTLSDPFWYHHDAGAVYSIGGAFVDFLLRRHGPERFVTLYFSVRPGTFKNECRRIYGVDLNVLEIQFWEDIEQQILKLRSEDRMWPR